MSTGTATTTANTSTNASECSEQCDRLDELSFLRANGASIRVEDGLSKPERDRRSGKTLKLTEAEIMQLYWTAQREAAAEADWRGVEWQGGSNRYTSLAYSTFES